MIFQRTCSLLATHYSLLVRSGKLPEKPDVILVEVTDIIDAVEKHREALEAHAEGVAAPDIGVVADGAEDGGIDHAAAADLDPFLVDLGQVAGFEIDLEARLGVPEVMWAEAGLGVLAEKRRENVVEQGLEVADRDVFVDVETLELMKIGRVGRVGGVTAVDASRGNDADRGARP